MFVTALICTAILTVSLLFQLIWALRFTGLYRLRAESTVPDEQLPRAAVVLSLRGADPSLAGCLNGLLRQNYPNYDVIIVVDDRGDPAWELVHQIVADAQAANVEIQPLEDRRETCSLKLSALVQAIGRLDESYQAVALIDADVHPGPNWLRELMGPLTEPGVGATNGVRWFVPIATDWGTLVRYTWNVAASMQMFAFHIPWGGSLAFRADVLRTSGILDDWTRRFTEDTGSYRTLKDLGLTIRTVNSATMVSRETTDLRNAFRFIRRQLICARLYHESWPSILTHGLLGAVATIATCILAIVALGLGFWGYAAWMIGLLAGELFGLVGVLKFIERRVQPWIRTRGEPAINTPWKIVLAIPLTHAVYYACLISAVIARRVEWRGITYVLGSAKQLRLVEYCPFRPSESTSDECASLI